MVAEVQAEAALQRKARDADIKARADVGQAAVLIGQGVRHSTRLHSHLHQQAQDHPAGLLHPQACRQRAAGKIANRPPLGSHAHKAFCSAVARHLLSVKASHRCTQ